MNTIYGYIFKSDEEKSLKDKKEVIRSMQKPTLYTNETGQLLKDYSIILDQELPDEDGKKFVDLAEYDVLYEGIVRLFTDNTFIENGVYKNFCISNIENKVGSDNYLTFIWANSIKFYIANTASAFKAVYPNPSKYYVVYDESQNVDNSEMLPLMAELCNQLGKDNIYNSVKEWKYFYDNGFSVSFYIFYSGAVPGELICQEVVRAYLINKYGLEEAKRRFPKLFITSTRKVFCIWDNEKEPINYDILKRFVEVFNVVSPEVIHVLDYVSPLVVEYGVSDIYINYHSQDSNDTMNNNFLFYISQVLNYFNGKKLTKDFIEESQFYETEDYCSVVTGGVEWLVMRKSYTKSYFELNK